MHAPLLDPSPSLQGPRTLAVDIGGSGIKTLVLDNQGQPISDRLRKKTPQPAEPEAVLETICDLASASNYERVSVGFPGVVQQGVIGSAVNLTQNWVGQDLAQILSDRLQKPVRVANDADIQGLGVIAQLPHLQLGVDLVITLGTGLGTALFSNGQLVPNLELAHHPFRKGNTYEEQLGRAALEKVGEKRWNRRLEKALQRWQALFNYDRLHIGGGEAKKISFELPDNATIVPNVLGLLGGIALWRDA